MRETGWGKFIAGSFFGLLLACVAAAQFGPRVLMPPRPPALDLDLIVNYITVTASKDAEVPRLSSRDFHLFEDNVEQKIEYFAVQDQPATIGIVWGAGTGFDDPAPDPDVRECPRTFMKNMVSGSEYFLLAGGTVTTSFTTNPELIPQNFAFSGASSDTVFTGLDVLKEAANSRKILLVITNPGGGGGGQLQGDYVERSSIRQGYQVHVVVFFDAADTPVDNEGQIFLEEVSELTGGSYSMMPVSNTFCAKLARELRTQYMIGYHPTNAARDGKWRKLGVKVDSPEDGPRLNARIKRGYYGAKDRG